MTRRDQLWIVACAFLGAGVVFQTAALKRAEARLQSELKKPYWPERPQPLGSDSQQQSEFQPSIGKAIPPAFWGEFAEDVHDCGGERTILVKRDELLFPGEERQRVETVRWEERQRIELDTRDALYSSASFGMLLSDDRDEITLIYTNMKRIVQRCATRSHEQPDTTVPDQNPGAEGTVDGEKTVSSNLTMNAMNPLLETID